MLIGCFTKKRGIVGYKPLLNCGVDKEQYYLWPLFVTNCSQGYNTVAFS